MSFGGFVKLDKELKAKQRASQRLLQRISHIEEEEEIAEYIRVYNKFFYNYPFYTFRTGASGTLELPAIQYYLPLSGTKVLILGRANNYRTYPVGRTTIPREYLKNGNLATTIPNINPAGRISAATSLLGHFVGYKSLDILKEYYSNLPIGEIVRAQEDYLDSNPAYRNAHYPRELFSDLEEVEESCHQIKEMIEILKTSITAKLNRELSIILEEINGLNQSILNNQNQIQEDYLQSQEVLAQKQSVFEELNSSEHLEGLTNKLTAIANNTKALQSLQEQIDNLDIQRIIEKEEFLQGQINDKESEYTQKITEKQNKEQEIRQKQERLRGIEELLESLEDEQSLESALVEVNQALARLEGVLFEDRRLELQAILKEKQEQLKLLEKQKQEESDLTNLIEKTQTKLEDLKHKQKNKQILDSLKEELEEAQYSNSRLLENLKNWHEKTLQIATNLGVKLCNPINNYKEKEEVDSSYYTYIAKDGERLDSIVYSHYGSLSTFEKVLSANPSLSQKTLLDAGDRVYLPPLDTEIKTLDALW